MKNLKIAHQANFKSRQEIVQRVRALKNVLEEAQKTKPKFSKDDVALKTYNTVIRARIQELTWVLNQTELFKT